MSVYEKLEDKLSVRSSVEEEPRCRRPAWRLCSCLVGAGVVLVFCEIALAISEPDQSRAVNLATVRQGNAGLSFPFSSFQTRLQSLGFRSPFQRSDTRYVNQASKQPVGEAPEWKDSLRKIPFKLPDFMQPYVEDLFKDKEVGLKGDPLEACSPGGRDGFCRHNDEVQQVCVIVKEGGFSVGCIDAWEYASAVTRDPEKAEGFELMCGASNLKLRGTYLNEQALSGKAEAIAATKKVIEVCGPPPKEAVLVRDKKSGKFYKKGSKFPISNPFDDPFGYW